MKKTLSVLLAGALTVAALSGCAGKGDGQTSANNEGGAGAAKKTFTMLVESHPSWPYAKDTLAWKYIAEKTGVTLDVQVPSGKLNDTINLNVASGSMPDITYMMDPNTANKYGQQGALANVLDYLDVMPNFKQWMDKNPDVAKAFLSADGKMYMLPNDGIGETNRMIWLYRQDIFEKNHLPVPTTFDELVDVLKKLKALYPDSYPFATRFASSGLDDMLRNFAPEFNTNEGFYQDLQTKAVKYGPVEDGYKTMLTYFNQFYKEGLMPPDWLTVDTKQWQEMMSTSKSFVTVDYISRIDFFNNAARKDNPDYKLAFMPPRPVPEAKRSTPSRPTRLPA